MFDLNKHIERQVAYAVKLLSRDEIPDNAALALALASGETAASLCEKAKAKVQKRHQPEAPVVVPVSEAPVEVPPAQKVTTTEVSETVPVDEHPEPKSHHKTTHKK